MVQSPVSIRCSLIVVVMMDKAKPIKISAVEFGNLVDRAENGTPAGPGSGVFKSVECPFCGYTRTETVLLGTRGMTCSVCGRRDQGICFSLSDGDGSCLCPVIW